MASGLLAQFQGYSTAIQSVTNQQTVSLKNGATILVSQPNLPQSSNRLQLTFTDIPTDVSMELIVWIERVGAESPTPAASFLPAAAGFAQMFSGSNAIQAIGKDNVRLMAFDVFVGRVMNNRILWQSFHQLADLL